MKSFNVGMLVILTGLVLQNQALATSKTVKNKTVKLCDFAPDNDLKIPAGTELAGEGIDEKSFNDVIDKVVKFYGPIVESKGGKLTVNRKWTDATVNASATRSGKTWTLNMYGGLARFKTMTPDGFALVMCHELGHHLGGFPKIKRSFFGSSWASNEGQADYFGTLKCFRRVFEDEDNAAIVSALGVPEAVTAVCQKTWKSQKEIALCQRSAITSKVLADTLYAMGRRGSTPREPATIPGFDTASTAQVTSTDDTHPLAQCRLDTYLAGSLCGIAYSEDFALDNAIGGACAQEKGDTYAYRPRCWYKPKKEI